MLLSLQFSSANRLSWGMLSVSIRRLSVPVKDCTPQWHLQSPQPPPIRALLAQEEPRLPVLQLATEWLLQLQQPPPIQDLRTAKHRSTTVPTRIGKNLYPAHYPRQMATYFRRGSH